MLVSRSDVDARRPAHKVAHEQVALSIGGEVATAMALPGDSVAQCLGELVQEHLYCMPCHATWSMHHVLAHLLGVIGPARTWLMSWTITEGPVRSIVKLMEDGLITDLRCVFDERVGKYNANALQLARKKFAHIGLTHTHAKCLVLVNDDWAITVLSTANITRNKRIEIYWVSTHRLVAEHHSSWIDHVLAKCQPLDHGPEGT
jgi:hypothetical protein